MIVPDVSGPIRPSTGASYPIGPTQFTPHPPQPGAKPTAEPVGDGLIVALSRIDGLTDASVLKSPFYFQCPPLDRMPRDHSWEWTDYPTIDAGTHSVPVAPDLTTITFDSIFVDNDYRYRFVLTNSRHVLSMLRDLAEIGDTMTPFQLQYGQPVLWGVWDAVMGVTMRSLHVEERHGEDDARYITCSFTEFRDVPRLVAVPPPPRIATAEPNSRSGAHETYASPRTTPSGQRVLAVLAAADLPNDVTLASLAKRYYGSVTDWRAIATASGLTDQPPNDSLRLALTAQDPPAKVTVPELQAGEVIS